MRTLGKRVRCQSLRGFESLSLRQLKKMNANIDLGWEEWVNLPAINLPYIKAKVDTGAQTSVLHAKHIEVFKVKNKKFVRFEISPLPEKPNFTISCSAPLTGRRKVTSSNGESEKRYFIKTDIEISGNT